MKILIISLSLFLFSFKLFAQEKSTKKGLGYGYHSQKDMEAISEGISWWYNWYHQPEATVASNYSDYNVDFVPMTWNGSFNESALRAFLTDHPDVKYLMGFNEPNFKSQANMTPAYAASLWPKLEAIAEDFNLELVAPAVNFCGNCVDIPGVVDDSDPVAWLDAFFEECADCKVDYIAIHWYACTVGALEWYVDKFEKYKLPIWLTEFACWENNPGVKEQIAYMIGALDYLESDTLIHKYAWFTGRSTGPGLSLFESTSGNLTELGDIYVNFNPVHDTSVYIDLPARIEAENYSTMQGLALEATSDVDGFANIGYTDVGDYLEYNINVPETNNYQFQLRSAGNSNGVINVMIDGVSQKDISLPATGGWQIWRTVDSKINLTEGRHKLRLKVKSKGFNLNWIFIGNSTVHVNQFDLSKDLIRIYPQPLYNEILNIAFEKELSKKMTVQLFNSQGQLVIKEQFHNPGNEIQINLMDRSLSAGLYFIEISSGNSRYFEKIIFGK